MMRPPAWTPAALLALAAAFPVALPAAPPAQDEFSGESALELTRQVVNFGPRPPGSAAAAKMQAFIVAKLKSWGWQVEQDAFIASTPDGRIPMKNIIAIRPAQPGAPILAVSGHADTKKFPFRFVGANDAGSSTGLLLEMARVLRNRPSKREIRLIFFDGEEALRDWTATDSLHGSRHLAEKWRKDGALSRIEALINVDMIGDRDLKVVRESYSYEPLMQLVWQVASDLGYARHFLNTPYYVEDDHTPFLRRGVRAVDLIDFDYGPNHEWWHTAQDTIDKLSPRSLEVVGRVVAETLRRLDSK